MRRRGVTIQPEDFMDTDPGSSPTNDEMAFATGLARVFVAVGMPRDHAPIAASGAVMLLMLLRAKGVVVEVKQGGGS